jgi:hypothetical protein
MIKDMCKIRPNTSGRGSVSTSCRSVSMQFWYVSERFRLRLGYHARSHASAITENPINFKIQARRDSSFSYCVHIGARPLYELMIRVMIHFEFYILTSKCLWLNFFIILLFFSTYILYIINLLYFTINIF